MIKLININVKFGNKQIFSKQSLIIEKGILTSITGESGAGKTTLLNIIGLNTFNSEIMIIDNLDIRKLNQRENEKYRE